MSDILTYPTRGRPSKRPGGGHLRKRDGYVYVGTNGTKKMEHVLVAERALGRPLPLGARVHHIDETRSNNAPSNLVICPDEGYHQLLHQRLRAFQACGHYDWRKCSICERYAPPAELYVRRKQAVHRACRNQRDRARYVPKPKKGTR